MVPAHAYIRVHLLQAPWINGRPRPSGPGREREEQRKQVGVADIDVVLAREPHHRESISSSSWDLTGEQWGSRNIYVDY